MSIATLLSFIGVSAMLTLAPGPDIVFVITQSISQGKRRGIYTALGLASGVMVHTTAAALGISIILYKSNLAFSIVKYAGAAYLLYLAYKEFTSKEEGITLGEGVKISNFQLYKKGIIMNILNPKVALFFLAFLPQFVVNNGTNVTFQMIVLGILFMLQAMMIFSTVATFSGFIGERLLNDTKLSRRISLGKGIIFGIIGLKIAFMKK